MYYTYIYIYILYTIYIICNKFYFNDTNHIINNNRRLASNSDVQ